MFFRDAGHFSQKCPPGSWPLLSSAGLDLKNVSWEPLFNLWRKEMLLLGLNAPEEMVTPALAYPSQGPCSLAEGKCSSVDLWHHLCLSKEMPAEAPGSPFPGSSHLCWPAAVSSCVCLHSHSSGIRGFYFLLILSAAALHSTWQPGALRALPRAGWQRQGRMVFRVE